MLHLLMTCVFMYGLMQGSNNNEQNTNQNNKNIVIFNQRPSQQHPNNQEQILPSRNVIAVDNWQQNTITNNTFYAPQNAQYPITINQRYFYPRRKQTINNNIDNNHYQKLDWPAWRCKVNQDLYDRRVDVGVCTKNFHTLRDINSARDEKDKKLEALLKKCCIKIDTISSNINSNNTLNPKDNNNDLLEEVNNTNLDLFRKNMELTDEVTTLKEENKNQNIIIESLKNSMQQLMDRVSQLENNKNAIGTEVKNQVSYLSENMKVVKKHIESNNNKRKNDTTTIVPLKKRKFN